jgi:hypothetical protein
MVAPKSTASSWIWKCTNSSSGFETPAKICRGMQGKLDASGFRSPVSRRFGIVLRIRIVSGIMRIGLRKMADDDDGEEEVKVMSEETCGERVVWLLGCRRVVVVVVLAERLGRVRVCDCSNSRSTGI